MVSPLENKLKQVFDDAEKAAEIIKNHPNQNFEQIQKSVNLNISAHVSTSNHIALFVHNVLNRKGDLKSLADSAAKRIVLSDARIEAAFDNLSVAQKAVGAEIIYNTIVADLTSYFENLKGKQIDQNRITDQLTTMIVKKVNQILSEKK